MDTNTDLTKVIESKKAEMEKLHSELEKLYARRHENLEKIIKFCNNISKKIRKK
jgi:hypothetical protein